MAYSSPRVGGVVVTDWLSVGQLAFQPNHDRDMDLAGLPSVSHQTISAKSSWLTMVIPPLADSTPMCLFTSMSHLGSNERPWSDEHDPADRSIETRLSMVSVLLAVRNRTKIESADREFTICRSLPRAMVSLTGYEGVEHSPRQIVL
jgi:hypothetical protein